MVGVGLADDFGMDLVERALDDYVLRLVLDARVYAKVSEFDVPHDVAARKLGRTLDLLRENGIPVRKAKRALHLLRGITGFRASPATFGSRVVGAALAALEPAVVRTQFEPLIKDLHACVELLTGPA